MAERHPSGILDTCAYIDLDLLDPSVLPDFPELTAITMAELQQGVAMATTAVIRAERAEKLHAAVADFDPLPFDGAAAARYGSIAALTVAVGRDPRPRKADLMIAAIASSRQLPLYTRNPKDFRGLDRLLTVVAL